MKRDGVIFLLENSTDYLFQLDQGFRNAQIVNPLRVARYGNEAILYLKGVGIYGDRAHYPLPQLIILDLAVPDGSGMAVLGWIRRQSAFDDVPVVILGDPPRNIPGRDTFDKSANAYYIQRDDFKGLARMIRSLESVSDSEKRAHRPAGSAAEASDEASDELKAV